MEQKGVEKSKVGWGMTVGWQEQSSTVLWVWEERDPQGSEAEAQGGGTPSVNLGARPQGEVREVSG